MESYVASIRNYPLVHDQRLLPQIRNDANPRDPRYLQQESFRRLVCKRVADINKRYL